MKTGNLTKFGVSAYNIDALKVGYFEQTAGTYFDTGVILGNRNFKIILSTERLNSEYCTIVGTQTTSSSSASNPTFGVSYGGNDNNGWYFNTDSISPYNQIRLSYPLDVGITSTTVTKTYCKIDTSVYELADKNLTHTKSLLLFTTRNESDIPIPTTLGNIFRFYNLSIYDENTNELWHNFIPVVISEEAYLYDEVTGDYIKYSGVSPIIGKPYAIEIATNEEYNKGVSVINVPNVKQVKNDINSLYKINSLNTNKVTILSNEVINASGTYDLLHDSSDYDIKILAYANNFRTIRNTVAASSYSKYNLVPVLTSNTSPGYIVSQSSANASSNLGYTIFDNISNSSNYWRTVNGGGTNSWVQIENVESTFRTNMFTIYQATLSHYPGWIYMPRHIQVQGSDDGINWTTIYDDPTAWVNTEISRTYVLNTYVTYKYLRLYFPGAQGDSHNRVAVSAWLIQDTLIHYGYAHNVITISDTVDDLTYYGSVIFDKNQMIFTYPTAGKPTLTNVYGIQYNKSVSTPLGSELGWSSEVLPTGFLWMQGQSVPEEYPELKLLYPDTLPTKPGFIIQATTNILTTEVLNRHIESLVNTDRNLDNRIITLEHKDNVDNRFKIVSTSVGDVDLDISKNIENTQITIPSFQALTSKGNIVLTNEIIVSELPSTGNWYIYYDTEDSQIKFANNFIHDTTIPSEGTTIQVVSTNEIFEVYRYEDSLNKTLVDIVMLGDLVIDVDNSISFVKGYRKHENLDITDIVIDYFPRTKEDFLVADRNWYRIWRSGFVEQGGRLTPAPTYSEITLLIPYVTNISRSVRASCNVGTCNISILSNTDIVMTHSTGAASSIFWWYASGYIKLGD